MAVKQKRVLLTGATGFVGRAVQQRIVVDGQYDLTIAVRRAVPAANTVRVVQVPELTAQTDWSAALQGVDVDYLTFKLNEKLKEKGETLELDENDNIKGWGDRLNGLKTQFPNMFESGDGGNGGYKPLGTDGLPKGDPNKSTEPKSLEEALKLQYEGNGE